MARNGAKIDSAHGEFASSHAALELESVSEPSDEACHFYTFMQRLRA
jgi:hypothetical protein